ncbi:MAG TPA: DUF1326 domain-containing protein [Nitrososphaeraceae archaeon]
MELEGDYFEGCNCKSICPCIFKLDSTEGECKVVVAWHIERGYFGNDGINLDNLNTVYAIYASGNMFTGPKWKLALYIDDKASEQQKDALTKIYSKSVSIDFAVEGKRRKLKIPALLEIEIEGLSGSNATEESVVINPGFIIAPGYDPNIARSTKYTYNDHGFEWDNSGRNGFYSRFRYES